MVENEVKRCCVCKNPFVPRNTMQVVCSLPCAAVKGAKESKRQDMLRSKRLRAEIRARKEKLKTRSDLLKEAQTAFNAWVRERDKDLPCISCGRMHQGKWNAGHYLSVGARPELRFDPRNVHRQCEPCNSYKSGNAIAYRVGLLARIGKDAVEWLEGPHAQARWGREQIVEIRELYRKLAREMKGRSNG